MNFKKSNTITNLKELKESYDKLYQNKPLKESEKHYKWVCKVTAPEKGKKLLDIACGGGYLLREAEKAGVETFGIDLSTTAIKIAGKNSRLSNLLCGAGEYLPFKDNFFDYTINLGSLEHFFDPEMGLKEMARVLKEGGKAVLLLPNSYFIMTLWKVLRTGGPDRQTDQEMDRWASKEEWSEVLIKSGLKIRKILKYNYKSSTTPLKYKLIRPFIPMNFSYCFLYLCSKDPKKKR